MFVYSNQVKVMPNNHYSLVQVHEKLSKYNIYEFITMITTYYSNLMNYCIYCLMKNIL